MDVVPCLTVKVELLSDAGSINSLKVASILVLILTPVAPFAGVVETTSGQIPVSPGSSLTFLHPTPNANSSSSMYHKLFLSFDLYAYAHKTVVSGKEFLFINNFKNEVIKRNHLYTNTNR